MEARYKLYVKDVLGLSGFRKELSQKIVAEGGTVAGAITMTYDHHKRELVNKLLDIQHDILKNNLSKIGQSIYAQTS